MRNEQARWLLDNTLEAWSEKPLSLKYSSNPISAYTTHSVLIQALDAGYAVVSSSVKFSFTGHIADNRESVMRLIPSLSSPHSIEQAETIRRTHISNSHADFGRALRAYYLNGVEIPENPKNP